MVKVKGSLILDSQTSEPNNPVEGEIYYNSNNKSVQVYNGSVFNNLSSLAAKGVAQNAYQTLKHAGTFDNKDNLGADRFTDADGVNNTVNTGSTTSFHDITNNKYLTPIDVKDSNFTKSVGTSDLNNGASLTTDEYDTTNNSIDLRIDASSFNTFSSDRYVTKYDIGDMTGKGLQFDIQTSGSGSYDEDVTHSEIARFYYGGSNIILTNSSAASIYIYDDGTTIYIYVNGTLSNSVAHNTNTYLTMEVQIEREATGQGGSFTAFSRIEVTSNYFIGVFGNSSIQVDSNTLTLTGDEKSICVYADEVNTANTNITYNVSDGTTTISDLTLNTVNGIASLGSGQLEITFNLSTTDNTETPELYGYGVYID